MRLPRAVRSLGAAVLGRLRLPIRAGPNRGLRWSVVSAGRGYLAGTFEAARVGTLLALLRPGDRVWDLGAHKGYVAMAAARRVGPEGLVVAVEPSEENLRALRRHLRWNRIPNVRVVAAAVSDWNGEGRFPSRGSSLAGRLGDGAQRVRVRTLERLAEEEGLPPPDVLKVDVEGEEAAVLRGAGGMLGPRLLVSLAVHSRPLFDACGALLRASGFRLHLPPAVRRLEAAPSLPWEEDEEVLAVGPGRSLDRAILRALPLFSGSPVRGPGASEAGPSPESGPASAR